MAALLSMHTRTVGLMALAISDYRGTTGARALAITKPPAIAAAFAFASADVITTADWRLGAV